MSRSVMLCCLTIVLVAACSPSTGEPNPLVVNPLQYRDDIVVNRLQLQVTNGLDKQLLLAKVQLQWEGFDSALTELDTVPGVGRRVDLPVGLDGSRCQINDTTIGPPPSIDDAQVVFTLADGTTRTADVIDDDDTLVDLFLAVAESKQPFRFVMQMQLDDEPVRPYAVGPPTHVHLEMLAIAAAGCAALNADGSLGGG